MIARALERTAALWPDVEYAYRFVHAVAHWLGNPHEESAAMVRRRVNGVLGAMQRHRARAGTLAGAFAHVQKVTRSYRPGLFGLASKKWRILYEAGGSPCRRAVLRESFRMRPSASF